MTERKEPKRYGKHQWPTDGVTKKALDRVDDRLGRRCDRAVERIRKLEQRLSLFEEHFESFKTPRPPTDK